MYVKKRFLSVVIIIMILISLIPSGNYAVQAAEELIFSNPVFTCNKEGEDPEIGIRELKPGLISVSLNVTNTGTERNALLIMALYRKNSLDKLAFDKKTLSASDTLYAELYVPETYFRECVLKVFVWDSIIGLLPLSDEYALSASKKVINSFTVQLGGFTYKGDINQMTKTITVDVPTQVKTNTGLTTSSSLLRPTDFQNAIKSVIPVITTEDNAEVSDVGVAKDFTNKQYYTVTASDGTSDVYEVRIEESILKRAQDMQTAVQIDPGHKFFDPQNPVRGGTPYGGTIGDGIWKQEGFKYKYVDGSYINEVDYESSAGILSLVADPDDASRQVFRMQKNKTESNAFSMSSCEGGAPKSGISKIVTAYKFRFEDIGPGSGVYTMIGSNRNLVIFHRNEDGTGFDLSHSKSSNASITKIPLPYSFEFGKWYSFRAVCTNEVIDEGNYKGTIEIYIDDVFITALTDYYTDDASLDTHTKFGSFPDTTYDMYLDDWSVTYRLR